MARERMITRTVTTTDFEVMAVNMDSKTVETITVSIPSAVTMHGKQIAKAIDENIPTGFVYVQTVSASTHETLYGMLEDDFIKYAKVLPSRTKTE